MQEGYLARFAVTKLTWKGNYGRIIAFKTHSLCTIDPKDLRITNEWSLKQIIGIDVEDEHVSS